MRITVDTNILAYAVDPGDIRGVEARRIMSVAPLLDCVLTNQVLGEFFNAVRIKKIVALSEARTAVSDWSLLFPILPTATDHLVAASSLAERHKLQFWDSVILTVAGAAGAAVLLTEDMGDGAVFNGVRIVNPFEPANAELIATLLTPSPGTA